MFHFHERMGLTPTLLRRINQHQINLLKNSFETLDVDPAIAHVEPIPPERQGGFLAIRSPYANHLFTELLARKVFTDFRNNLLRLGPAPYLTDKQLLEASSHLGAILKGKF
ncbi:hypothetical protein [Legionella nagasakiensis]|uniref:kynureninase/PvdN C-terminal domain-containing protein n=1 Tax=Legionella nagasakiensis TaxID=535290 RepID=UPI001A94AC2A|nr:hypothetical protein [Legionella nagasakiensis]